MSVDTIATGDNVTEAAGVQEEEIQKIPILDSLKSVSTLTWQSLKSATRFNERVGHALIARKTSKTLYMLGGGNHQGDITEVWELNYDKNFDSEGLTWSSHPATAKFGGRYEFAACLNPTEDKIWIFGGADFQQPRNDVCFLDLENNDFVTKFALNRELATQTKPENENEDFGVPFPRTQGGNSCLLDVEGKTYMAVYGGGVKGEHAVADGHLYLFDIDSGEWQRIVVSGDTPGIRQGHAMTSVGTKIFLHGGMHEFTIFDDVYSIDLAGFKQTNPSWVKINTEIHPKGRAAQGLAKDGQNIYIFGGLGDEGALGDLWLFNTESLEWTELKTSKFPTPRLDVAIALIDLGEGSNEDGSSKKILLVHGGMNTEGTLFNDFMALALP